MISPKRTLEEYPLTELLKLITSGTKVQDKLPTPFFRHAAPFLAQNIPLVIEDGLISPSKTITKMRTIVNKLVNMIFKLYALAPRTDILAVPQGKVPELSTAVPLTMAALKDFQGIDYNAWDKNDPSIVYFLGTGLQGLHLLQQIDRADYILDSAKVVEYRNIGQTYLSGKKANKQEPPTAWKLNKIGLLPSEVNDKAIPRVDVINRMLLQTWVFNKDLRQENMILDPWDWEATPEPWDMAALDLANPLDVKASFMEGLPF